MTYKWLVHSRLHIVPGGPHPKALEAAAMCRGRRLRAVSGIRRHNNDANLIDGPFTETKEAIAPAWTPLTALHGWGLVRCRPVPLVPRKRHSERHTAQMLEVKADPGFPAK